MNVSVSSTNLQNTTTVAISVELKCAKCRASDTVSAFVKLKQNGTQIVNVCGYSVTVVVNGNNKITNIYLTGTQSAASNQQNSQGQNNNGQGNQK